MRANAKGFSELEPLCTQAPRELAGPILFLIDVAILCLTFYLLQFRFRNYKNLAVL